MFNDSVQTELWFLCLFLPLYIIMPPPQIFFLSLPVYHLQVKLVVSVVKAKNFSYQCLINKSGPKRGRGAIHGFG